jgi:hypothetical protein
VRGGGVWGAVRWVGVGWGGGVGGGWVMLKGAMQKGARQKGRIEGTAGIQAFVVGDRGSFTETLWGADTARGAVAARGAPAVDRHGARPVPDTTAHWTDSTDAPS